MLVSVHLKAAGWGGVDNAQLSVCLENHIGKVCWGGRHTVVAKLCLANHYYISCSIANRKLYLRLINV